MTSHDKAALPAPNFLPQTYAVDLSRDTYDSYDSYSIPVFLAGYLILRSICLFVRACGKGA